MIIYKKEKKMEIIKTIIGVIFDVLVNYLSFTGLFTIITSFILVFLLEMKLLPLFDSILIIYTIRAITIVILYYFSILLRFKFQIKLSLILGYIIFTLAFLLSNNINNNINTKVQIEQKTIFKTEEERKKYIYGTIDEKIIILKDIGLSKQEVYKKLENNTDFRELIKDKKNKFEEVYDNN